MPTFVMPDVQFSAKPIFSISVRSLLETKTAIAGPYHSSVKGCCVVVQEPWRFHNDRETGFVKVDLEDYSKPIDPGGEAKDIELVAHEELIELEYVSLFSISFVIP